MQTNYNSALTNRNMIGKIIVRMDYYEIAIKGFYFSRLQCGLISIKKILTSTCGAE